MNEFEKAGLEPAKSYKVRVPRVARAKAWFECRLLKHEELFGSGLLDLLEDRHNLYEDLGIPHSKAHSGL